MQACSLSSLSGPRAVPLGSVCPLHPYLHPVRPVNKCFVSKNVQGAALAPRLRARLNVSTAAASTKANPLAVLGSSSGDVFVAGIQAVGYAGSVPTLLLRAQTPEWRGYREDWQYQVP